MASFVYMRPQPSELAWTGQKLNATYKIASHGSLNFMELTEITEHTVMSVTESVWVLQESQS